MDQSKSSKEQIEKRAAEIALPRKTFTVEFFVGLFTVVGLACAGYLAIGLGGLEVGRSNFYEVYAEFDNISGLKHGASVEIAGVKIGEVSSITLDDSTAVVTLKINNDIKLRRDDMPLIRTKGIIGDRYVKISRGASQDFVKSGEHITETESVVDFEDIIGKIVHNLGNSGE